VLMQSRLARYLLVGGGSYAVELSLLVFLTAVLNLNRVLSTALAFWVGLVLSFVLQKLYAFQDYQKELRTIGRQTGAFSLLVGFNYCFTLVVVSLFSSHLIIASRTLAIACTTTWNYFIYKRIFTGTKNSLLDSAASLIIGFSKSIHGRYRKNERRIFKLVCLVSIVSLLGAGLYTSVKASYYQSVNADALSSVYASKDFSGRSQVHVLDDHTNAMKLPILGLQGRLFNYDYTSFVALNIVLVLITLSGVVFIVYKWLGSRAIPLVCLPLASMLIASSLFAINIVYATTRNIEFLIAFWLLFQAIRISKHPANWQSSLAFVIYGLLIASDLYFFYVWTAPILLLFAALALIRKGFGMVKALIYVAASSLFGLITMLVLAKTDVLVVVHAAPGNVVTESQLLPQLNTTFFQILHLFGAYIFGKAVSFASLGNFLNFVVAILCIYAFFVIGKSLKTISKNSLPVVANWLAILFIVLSYAFSNKVVAGDERYLVFAVLLLVINLAWLLIHRFNISYGAIVVISLVLLAGMAVQFMKQTRAEYLGVYQATNQRKAAYVDFSNELLANNVHEAFSAYWTASPTRFWSGNKVMVSPIEDCNKPMEILTNEKWYVPTGAKRTAIIFDNIGPDGGFWSACGLDQLAQFYGQPAKTIQITEPDPSFDGTLLVYNYDIRTKMDQNYLKSFH